MKFMFNLTMFPIYVIHENDHPKSRQANLFCDSRPYFFYLLADCQVKDVTYS